MPDWLKRNRSPILWTIGCALALAVYLSSCKSLWKWNPLYEKDSPKSYDQVFYIASAHDLARGATGLMPRSRMPLYPWLMHFFSDPKKPLLEELPAFIRLNIGISVLCLAAIFLMLRKPLGTWLAVLTTLVAAFRVFVFKAVLVQPEILFFTLYLGLFLLMLRYLKEPSWRLAVGGGWLAGIAHLTKGSGLATSGIFLAFAFLAEGLRWWRARNSPPPSRIANLLRPLAFAAAFLSVTGIWIRNNLREYDSPFYDPNTRYYLWAESPREMLALQHLGLAIWKPRFDKADAGDSVVASFLPKWAPDPKLREELLARAAAGESVVLEGRYDILPGARNWMASHTWRDVAERIWTGFFGLEDDEAGVKKRRRIEQNPLHHLVYVPSVGTGESLIGHNRDHPNGYWDFLRFMFAAALVSTGLGCVFSWRAVRDGLRRNWLPIAFAVSVFLVMGSGYAWWAHVSNRNRFFLTLYLPLLTCFGMALRFACAHVPVEVKIVWHRRTFMLNAYAVVLIAYTLFALEDLNDPLNRRDLPNPKELHRQIVQ